MNLIFTKISCLSPWWCNGMVNLFSRLQWNRSWWMFTMCFVLWPGQALKKAKVKVPVLSSFQEKWSLRTEIWWKEKKARNWGSHMLPQQWRTGKCYIFWYWIKETKSIDIPNLRKRRYCNLLLALFLLVRNLTEESFAQWNSRVCRFKDGIFFPQLRGWVTTQLSGIFQR